MIYVAVFNLMVLLRYALGRLTTLPPLVYPALLITLFVFSAFRFEVGCDWGGYWDHYEGQRHSTMAEALTRSEPLWWAIIEIIHKLNLSYPWLNVASAGIFFSGVHALARRQPDPIGFLILLFPVLIINMPMSGIRQGAAIGIMCFAFAAFLDKALLRFVALTLLASTLHASAAVFLLLSPLVGGGYTYKRLALAALLAIPGSFLLLSGSAAEQAIATYVDSGVDAAGAAFRVALLILTGLLFVLCLRRKWEKHFPDDYKLVSMSAGIMIASIVVLPASTVIADRIAYYMIPVQTVIFARIPYLPIENSRTLYIAAPYAGLAFFFLVWTSISWHFEVCYLPYRSWLFGFPQEARFSY